MNTTTVAPTTISLAVLIFGGWQISNTLLDTPAFNASIRVESITGDETIPLTAAMYDTADYLFQLAYGYENADSLFLPDDAGIVGLASPELAADRMQKARRYARASLSANPANAHAWIVLALAENAVGDDLAALQAYRFSARLAPYNHSLATSRALFAASYAEQAKAIGADVDFPTPQDEAIIRADLETLSRHASRVLDGVIAQYPEMAKYSPETEK